MPENLESRTLEYEGRRKVKPSLVFALASIGAGLLAGILGWAHYESRSPLSVSALPIGLVAVVCGILGVLHGRSRLARGGVLLSLLGFLLGAGGIGAALLPKTSHCGLSNAARCRINITYLGKGMLLYANDHQGRLPDKIGDLIDADIMASVFVCPSSADSPVPTSNPTAADIESGGHCSYIYLGKGLNGAQTADFVLLYEPLSNHQNTTMNVLFGDLHVESFELKDATWILSELNSGHNPPRFKLKP